MIECSVQCMCGIRGEDGVSESESVVKASHLATMETNKKPEYYTLCCGILHECPDLIGHE